MKQYIYTEADIYTQATYVQIMNNIATFEEIYDSISTLKKLELCKDKIDNKNKTVEWKIQSLWVNSR